MVGLCELSSCGGPWFLVYEQPIILLVKQTVGGYAKAATIISTDLGKVAQSTPGDTIIFEPVDLKTAHKLYRQEQKRMEEIRQMFG
jgi:allophanate hydrolase subunit 2